ncbi:hypothetical protein GTCCBUS3UF5_6170 [Geobacillus thermoleovorans CCB_US3_UF5]|uniref:Uncharacterized protein n=1 Tax=Geobacillus thermoleovorans CCB_US3_UF5 TaxID=1111068 RepID=A0ABM5MEI9_GEOTH|nr:hypothetical protein GTCCBUS3UF5_6170 [Geobacillus thermoleovorans CCB_US3_UF5]GAJ60162.1 hypothetical protein B23_3388 [Geobacillus thermoleovorans B23]
MHSFFHPFGDLQRAAPFPTQSETCERKSCQLDLQIGS